MNFTLGRYIYLLLFLMLPVLGSLMIYFVKWRKYKKEQFAEQRFQPMLFSERKGFSRLIPMLYLVAVSFLVISIVDILVGSEEAETKQKMNNVIFVLDVSNSMNVEDVMENRLVHAKNIMFNTIAKLQNDRVGMIVFAGEAHSVMPLTTDFSAVENYVAAIETSMVKVQGTDFLKAMQAVEQKFKNIPRDARQIVLISDGEDNEGNDRDALRLAQKQNIRITAVGIGTEQGAPVPEYIYGQLMGYKTNPENGETVISKRQSKALAAMASGTDGRYISGDNLEQATSEIIESIHSYAGSENIRIKTTNAVHYYQYFLAISLFFFLLIYFFNPKKDTNL